MPAVGITDGQPTCVRDQQAVVLSCPHLVRRLAVPERCSAWLVVGAEVKACSRETHSPSRASKTYGHNAFNNTHTHHCYQQWSHTHYSTLHTLWGCAGELASALAVAIILADAAAPHRLRNDLKCVEWDVKPCSIKSMLDESVAIRQYYHPW